jgi:uncharacterized membrane protein YeaQ/YmgE (transglycosylase-associated protein family)
MFILGIICLGLLAGAVAQMVFGRSMNQVNWTAALVTGLVGSLVGGLLANLITGHGLEFRMSGILGSIVGAIIVTGAWGLLSKRS